MCIYSRVVETLSTHSEIVPSLCELGIVVGLEMRVHIAVQVVSRRIMERVSKEVPEKGCAATGEVSGMSG